MTDTAEGLSRVGILHFLSNFHLFPSDWFSFSFKGKWQFDVNLGCLMFPLVSWLSHVKLNLLPNLPFSTVTVSNVEQSIVAIHPVEMAIMLWLLRLCLNLEGECFLEGSYSLLLSSVCLYGVQFW